MATINNFSSALDSLAKQQTLRVDADGGNLHAVTGTEKIGLAFQKYILRKSPDQLGTSQAKIAGALVGLYKNENPGVTNNQVSKLLDKLGFTAFASLLKNQPDLSSRQVRVEAGPVFSDEQFGDDADLYGTFTKSDPNRAGVANTPSLQTHVSVEELDQIVQSLNLKSEDEPKAPQAAPRTKVPSSQTHAQPSSQSSTQQISRQGALPEHLASAEEINQALEAIQSERATKKPAAERLSAAASYGREIAAKKAAETTSATVPSNPLNTEAQIKDIENRLKLAEEGKHVNPEGTKMRPFKEGEKEKDVAELKAKLQALRPPAQSASKNGSGALKLIEDLKTGVVHDRNFSSSVYPLIVGHLGPKAHEIAAMQKGDYYHHLGASKARYTDIGVPKDTAVSLKKGEVFHANYIPLGGFGDPTIATQAPLESTMQDFVQMVQEQNVTTIIDLTNVQDRLSRGIPDYARKSEHGFVSTDKTSSQLQGAGIQKRELKTASEHTVSYLNFTNWPDKGVIELGQLKGLVSVIAQEHGSKSGGFAIHCTAGVGRTGTVYAALELDRLAKSGELSADNFADKVLEVVAEGRKARGFAFVQAPGQLNLLFDFAKTLV